LRGKRFTHNVRSLVVALGAAVAVGLTAWSAWAMPEDRNAIVDDVAGVAQTDSPKRQQPETSIATSPAGTIVAAAQDLRRARIQQVTCGGNRWNGFYRSTDGGTTWSNELVPGFCSATNAAERGVTAEQPGGSPMQAFDATTDPVVAFDRGGNLYYAHIAIAEAPLATTPPCFAGRIFVSTYTDEAATYTRTVPIPAGRSQQPFICGPGFANFDDKEWMIVDRYDEDAHPDVLVTWTRFETQGGESSIWFSKSTDGGETFSKAVLVNKPVAGGLVQESMPATDPSGNIYVIFLQFQGGFGSTLPHSGIWVAKSTDGGKTFTQKKIADIRQIPDPLYPGGFRTGTVPGIDADANGLYAVWGELVDGKARVSFTRSTDGGATWSTPVDLSQSTGHAFFPALEVEGGNVDAVWYDSRLSTTSPTINNLDVFRRHAASSSGALSFGAPTRVTDQSFNPNTASRFPVFCAPFIGDYIDLDRAGGGPLVIDWTDNREVVNPLTSAECQDFIQRATDPTIQPRLDSGALDQETFVDVIP
jgi:hypothetical protein